MEEFRDDRAAKEAAKLVRARFVCPIHKERAEFEVRKTAKGFRTTWTFCCDELKNKIETAYPKEVEKAMGKEFENAVKSIFKNSKIFKIR